MLSGLYTQLKVRPAAPPVVECAKATPVAAGHKTPADYTRIPFPVVMSLESNSKTATSAEYKPAASTENRTSANANKRERTGCLLAFDWIIRPWHYFDTKPRAVAYVCAGSGFYGGILFVIGSFAGCSPAVKPPCAAESSRVLCSRQVLRASLEEGLAYLQVANSHNGGDGLKTQYDWLVLFIFMVGTYVFTVGCTLLYVDANNAEYPGAMAGWKANGRQGKKPR